MFVPIPVPPGFVVDTARAEGYARAVRILVALFAFFVGLGAARAETPVLEVKWNDLAAQEKLQNGKLLAGIEGGALRVETGPDGPHNVVVLEIDAPPLSGPRWRLEGRMRYQNVESEGHLILISKLEGRDYTTKTVAYEGPIGKITGSSDWRRFALPFRLTDQKGPPEKLTLQVFLPGSGIVDLSPVQLYADFDDELVANLGPRIGWNQGTMGMAAGLFGGLLGLIGAILGLLNATKQSLRLIWGIHKTAMGLCLAAALTGAFAIFTGVGGGWLMSVGIIGAFALTGISGAIKKQMPVPGAPVDDPSLRPEKPRSGRS